MAITQIDNSSVEGQQWRRNIARSALVLICLIVAAVVLLISDTQFDIDDAPITYRYAENIALGKGFVYNEGERVLGTSTPLYAVLLAGLRVVGVSVPAASNVIGFVSAVIVVWLVFLITLRISDGSELAASLAVAYLLVQDTFLRFAMAGMETPLYTAIILAAFYFFGDNRANIAAALAGLAFITRLDGLAVGVAVFGTVILWERRWPVIEAIVYTAVVVPWLIFATLYFGSPIPLSMLAKQRHLKVDNHSRYWIWNHLFVSGLGSPMYLLPFGIVGLIVTVKRYKLAFCMFLWLVTYLIAYTVVGIDFYEWYLMPAHPVLAVFVGTGIGLIISTVWSRYIQDTSKWWQILAGLLMIFMLVAWWLPYVRHADSAVRSWHNYLNELERSRVEAGQWLATNTPPDSVVYTGFIGHVGYQSGRYVLDGAGLVTPRVVLESTQPGYYVLQGSAPDRKECGPVAEFAPRGFEKDLGITLVFGCELLPEGAIGPFTLADFRITHAVRTPEGEWKYPKGPKIETQWLVDQPLVDEQWTIITHFVDESGQTVAQADHLLGRQIDGSVVSLSAQHGENRIYVYTNVPDNWNDVRDQIESVRIGLWKPETREYLPIVPGRSRVDDSNLLKIDLDSIDKSQTTTE